MNHGVNCTFKSLFSRKFFKVIDSLISDFDIRFNKEFIDIVEATKFLHPFDSFESFNENDLNVLYNHYSIDFTGHNDKKILLNEYTHYKKDL